jgi:hypothetical protein
MKKYKGYFSMGHDTPLRDIFIEVEAENRTRAYFKAEELLFSKYPKEVRKCFIQKQLPSYSPYVFWVD